MGLKSAPRQQGIDEIFHPGEREALSDRRLRAERIVVPEDTPAKLPQSGREIGVTAPF